MVAQVGALRVAVGADITGLQTGMRRAERQVRQSASAMQKAVGGINSSFKGLGTVAGVSLGAAGILAGARAFLSVADAAKRLQSQLKLATAEYGSLAKANRDVRTIAEGTRSDLIATAELYAALQRNSGQLGTTQQQVARATETVTKAFKISGAATSEQSAATRQLIQAFQSGVLRGDEFNSVMENAPRLAKLLADSLGVTVGQLRNMAHEGELTSDKLVKAFTDKKFTAGIDAEFKVLPVTFDEAMTGLYNAAVITFSAFDRGGQFSNSIASFVTDGTKGFKDLEDSAFDFGRGLRDLFDALEVVRAGIGNMHGDGVGAFSAMTDWSMTFREALRGVLSLLDSVIEAYARVYNAPGNVLRGALGMQKVVYDSRFAENFDERTRDKRSGSQRFSELFRGGTGRTPPPFRAPAGKPKKPKASGAKKPPQDRSEDVTAQFENELRQAQMDLLRAQQKLSNDYVERTQISLQMLDLEKQMRDAEIDERVRRAEKDAADGKITKGALDEVKIHAATLKAASIKQDALERQAVLAEQEAQRYEDSVRLDALTLELDERKLQSEAQLADTAKEQRAIQLRLLDLSYKQERARYEAVLADQQATAAAKEDARRRLSALSETYGNDRSAVMKGTQGPLETYMNSLPLTAAKMNEALENVAANGLKSLEDGIMSVIDGTKSLGEAFRDMASQIISDLLRISIQKAIIAPLANALFPGAAVGLAEGGFVSGPGGPKTDSIPAMLSNGEFVVNADATRQFLPVLEKINSGALALARGGLPVGRADYGARVNVSNDNARIGRGMGDMHFHFQGAVSDRAARRTGLQAASAFRGAVARAVDSGV